MVRIERVILPPAESKSVTEDLQRESRASLPCGSEGVEEGTGENVIRKETGGMGMGEGGILQGCIPPVKPRMIRRPQRDGEDAHERAVALRLQVKVSLQGILYCLPHIRRIGGEPGEVFLAGDVRVVPIRAYQGTLQAGGHLRVICHHSGLTIGYDAEPRNHLLYTAREVRNDVVAVAKFSRSPQGIPRHKSGPKPRRVRKNRCSHKRIIYPFCRLRGGMTHFAPVQSRWYAREGILTLRSMDSSIRSPVFSMGVTRSIIQREKTHAGFLLRAFQLTTYETRTPLYGEQRSLLHHPPGGR